MKKLSHNSFARLIFNKTMNKKRKAADVKLTTQDIMLSTRLDYLRMLEDHKLGDVNLCQN